MYTNLNRSSQQTISLILPVSLLSLIIGCVLLYDLVFFGAFILGITIVSLSLLKPKLFIYFVLFASSFISYLVPETTFFAGTVFHINFNGLRNLIIIAVSIPLVSFNFRKVIKAEFFMPILLFFISFSLTTLINFSIDNLRFYTNVISPIFLYLLMVIFIENDNDKKFAFHAIILSSLIPIAVAILQFFNILPVMPLPIEMGEHAYAITKRISSTFDHPNIFGIYMVMFSLISIFMLIREKDFVRKTQNVFYCACVHISLLMTFSRNAIFAMCMTYMVIVKAKFGLLRAILIGSLLLIVLFSMPNFNQRLITPSAQTKISIFEVVKKFDMKNIDQYSMKRISIWQGWIYRLSKSSFRENILGHGYDKEDIKQQIHFHSAFLKTYWVNGFICCIFLVYLMLYVVRRLYLWMRESFRENKWDIYYLCAFGYAFATTVMTNFDNTLSKYQLFIYYFALIALAEKNKKSNKNENCR